MLGRTDYAHLSRESELHGLDRVLGIRYLQVRKTQGYL